jgi:cytochrome b pre-mRNA-processing protein 3
MFSRFFRSGQRAGRIASVLYGAIVAQARAPAFYGAGGVADSVDGRFELLVVHLALVLRRLAGLDDRCRALGQEVFDLFCADMDRSLREMGIGDLGVPRRMKEIAAAYYGRAAAYDAAIAGGDRKALAAVVQRNLVAGEGVALEAMAAYLAAAAAHLESVPPASFAAGRLAWPQPAAAVPASLA